MMLRTGVAFWLVVGWIGFAIVPWNAIGGSGFLAFNWWASYPSDVRVAPAVAARCNADAADLGGA